MKVSDKKYREVRSAESAGEAKSPEIKVINNVDLKPLEAPISELVGAVRDSQIPDNTENLIFAIKSVQGDSDKKQEAFIKYLGEKIDVLVKTLKEKPTSFAFDVERNNNGFIKTVLVKPIK